MENESMKMTLSIIHSAPVKYIVFTVCLVIGVLVIKKVLGDLINTSNCPAIAED